VFAETNYDYARSREILEEMSARFQKSWSGRFFSALNWKRKKMTLEDEMTPDPDFVADLAAYRKRELQQQINDDLRLAHETNSKQYEEAGQSLECACCFGDFAFEEVTHCGEGHIFCQSCVRHLLREQLFGESAGAFKQLTCFSGGDCQSEFSATQIQRSIFF